MSVPSLPSDDSHAVMLALVQLAIRYNGHRLIAGEYMNDTDIVLHAEVPTGAVMLTKKQFEGGLLLVTQSFQWLCSRTPEQLRLAVEQYEVVMRWLYDRSSSHPSH